jgi:NAD(P)-dependent dehydrogenase (short-subunit alcohol dehydrogenase family)
MTAYNPIDLSGKNIVVTGSGSGIGRATAIIAAKCGATVHVTDVNLANARETVAQIVEAGGMGVAYELDVSDPDQSSRLAGEIQKTHGDVSGLVNNAGIGFNEQLGDPDFREKWLKTMAVNANGPIFVVDAFLEQLTRTRGAVVNVSSGSAFAAKSKSVSLSYVASKGAVRALTQSLAHHLAGRGIRVNGVAPGFVATPMTETPRKSPQLNEQFLARIPLARAAEPSEIAVQIVNLLSDAASFMTGTTVVIDGGSLA